MRSSNAWARRAALALGCAALLIGAAPAAVVVAAPAPAPAEGASATGAGRVAPDSLAELLARFGEMPGLEARFVEEKHLELLVEPLRSRGRLYFLPPATLLRRVESPQPVDVLVTPSHVRISEGGREQVIDLASRGEVRPLVESMLWIFAGDRVALERAYRVDYEVLEESGGRGWQLRLVPREAPLDQLIGELRIRGTGLGADTIEVIEASGDRTVTRILEADPQRRFDADERRELFGPAAR